MKILMDLGTCKVAMIIFKWGGLLSKVCVTESQVEAYKYLLGIGESEEKMLLFIDEETLNDIKKGAIK